MDAQLGGVDSNANLDTTGRRCTIWYMHFSEELTIAARPAQVWEVYADVERWPEWATTFDHVRYLEGSDLQPGSRVEIRQPKLPTARWEITEVDPGRSWTWVARGPGVRTTATHVVEGEADGTTRVRQELTQEGPLGVIAGRLSARLTRRYLAEEARGLKARVETTANP